MPLGQRLKQLREDKGLSIRKAASGLDVNYGSLSSIETGRSFPGSELLERIASLYEVPRLELEAEQAVDRCRIEVPPGVSAQDIREAVYRLAGKAAPEQAPVDPQGYECPECGAKLRCVKG